ncbi:1-phosphatidylinositol 4,5-bisphosphate phosphodiesterase zeta-1 isoform X2 [Ambystoma mexicanum]
MDTASALIREHQITRPGMKKGYMSMEGFARMMTSPDMYIFKKRDKKVNQNMNLPLCHYFISSSHNTYLSSDQLVGKSELTAYASALLGGCRCVEIDCWDGPNNEPIVTHGGTLTSKLLFKDVLEIIKTCAFAKSPYPIILSVENHCNPSQKDVMAVHLKNILGDMLVTQPLRKDGEYVLPSPEQLKHKILIKDKIYYKNTATSTSEESEEEDDPDSCPINSFTTPRKRRRPKENVRTHKTPKWKLGRTSKVPKMEMSDEMLTLSTYVIYVKATKFQSFDHSKNTQKFDQSTSLSENKARKLSECSAADFVAHTTRFFTRIYPKGTRVDSSNYNPQPFWNVGCQMVSLNFQTAGISMDLERGKFRSNGGCGYILKPEFLRNLKSKFDPHTSVKNFRPAVLTIQILRGNQLVLNTETAKGLTLDPYVTVEIHGVPLDEAKQQTKVKKRNSFNPEWNQTLAFTIQCPELALVRFCVENQKAMSVSEIIGQNTLSMTSMSRGFRQVPLYKKNGDILRSSTLFVHVNF